MNLIVKLKLDLDEWLIRYRRVNCPPDCPLGAAILYIFPIELTLLRSKQTLLCILKPIFHQKTGLRRVEFASPNA